MAPSRPETLMGIFEQPKCTRGIPLHVIDGTVHIPGEYSLKPRGSTPEEVLRSIIKTQRQLPNSWAPEKQMAGSIWIMPGPKDSYSLIRDNCWQ